MGSLDSGPRVANNPRVVRRLAASALIVLLPFGAAVTPFVHAHEDDHHSSHHDGRQIHAHLSSHSAPARDHHGTSLTEDDAETARDVPLFVAVETVTFTIPLLVPARMELAAPAARVVSSRPRVAHAHDPPERSPLGPRPPPSCLS